MKKKNKKHGGKRKGAGRKPIADKKNRILVFIEQSRIDARGGEEAMKKHLYESA